MNKFTHRLLACSIWLTVLASLSSPAIAEGPVTESHNATRLRLFGQNGVAVRYYPNSACHGGNGVTVSGGFGDAFSSLLGTVKNESIGIPDTPNTLNQAARNGILSKTFFREYEVVPGQPLTIAMTFMNTPNSPVKQANGVTSTPSSEHCKTIATTFIPEQGKDYEGVLDIRRDLGLCIQSINEVKVSPHGGVELTPVDVELAEPCSS